jgi:DNA-binding transcriptional LysR family regulator
MPRLDLNNLQAFLVVARERSFTRAAAQMGVSQSALSHSMRGLEEKMGIRLLTRTTRGVSPTEAGERLLQGIGPLYEGIEAQLAALGDQQGKPAGTIRISTHDYAATTYLWPRLSKLLPENPELKVELSINYKLIDIVADRFDAGVRLGDQVAKDMVAVRISPDIRMAVVGAPVYLAAHGTPLTPQELTGHNCINMRLPTHGGLYAWEFEKACEKLEVQVDGQSIFNTTGMKLAAAVDGYGLTYLPEGMAQPYVAAGQLVQVLQDWCPTFPGYHLYYPSRRQSSRAFSLVVDALRHLT